MTISVAQLSLKVFNGKVGDDRPGYRPLAWPPPDDWPVTDDSRGAPCSLFRDRIWNYSAWRGKSAHLRFFRAGKRDDIELSAANERALKELTILLTHGEWAATSWATLYNRHRIVRKVVSICDEEKILASDLSRFPRVLHKVAEQFNNKRDREILILLLDRLLRARDKIGFALVDERGLVKLREDLVELYNKDIEQTAYIPPRIWKYQVTRLRECLDDFLAHKQKLEDCFNFCLNAYRNNYGSLESALTENKNTNFSPFRFDEPKEYYTGKKFYGSFRDTAQKFGVDELLDRWIGASNLTNLGIRTFSSYFSLIRIAGMAYVANFTLQRSDEAAKLRTDCLIWDNDSVIGRIAIIRGETTKTKPDSDARWPTSPSVEKAIDALALIVKLRSMCAIAHPRIKGSAYDWENPPLLIGAFEPWASTRLPRGGNLRVHVMSYRQAVHQFPLLFDLEQLRITEEDLRIARMFTPNLEKKGGFAVGKIWPLGYHQLRRTGAINMFASGLLRDTSIQFLMKHLTLFQTHYYGRNFTKLRFSDDFEKISTEARYEVLAKQAQAVVTKRYVAPLGERRKQDITAKIVTLKDFRAMVKAGKNGQIAFRETLLGGCASEEYCDYGGIESVSKCAGGDDDGVPCNHALFDRAKREAANQHLKEIKRKSARAQPGSPRKRALEREAKALRRYLNVTR
ncbi:integrase family protein [Burkholderia pseudomallei]|nr:integrase family protein [Burkholderia pseudomallei]